MHWFTLFEFEHDHKVIHPFSTCEIKYEYRKEVIFIPLRKLPKACATKREEGQPFVEDSFHLPRTTINHLLHLRDAGFANLPQYSESQVTTFPRL
jgi:hypothetical protein